MSWRERLFDLTIMALLAPFLINAEPLISILLLMTQGRPVFYLSRRMKSQHQHFSLIKFRTTRACTLNAGVTGGDKFARITPIGRLLRQTRLDELPQALNVLRGDIRLVGPRPPLPCYVRNNPDLYAKVLSAKPGKPVWPACFTRMPRRAIWPAARPQNKPTPFIMRGACRERQRLT